MWAPITRHFCAFSHHNFSLKRRDQAVRQKLSQLLQVSKDPILMDPGREDDDTCAFFARLSNVVRHYQEDIFNFQGRPEHPTPPTVLSHPECDWAGCWPPCDLQPEPSLISSATSTLCGVARGQRISSGASRPTALSPGFMWKDEPHSSPFFFFCNSIMLFLKLENSLSGKTGKLQGVVQNLRGKQGQQKQVMKAFCCCFIFQKTMKVTAREYGWHLRFIATKQDQRWPLAC